nr:type I-E CRISPR-associated protein Cse2/CasB [Mangrovactinospora gilvigrisea]
MAIVARLRREAGRDAHVSPTAWGLAHLEMLADLREEAALAEQDARRSGAAGPADLTSAGWRGRETYEQREDTAVHLAVTLWALHQQSLRDEAMHQPGWPLGRAVRRLAQGGTGTRDALAPEDSGNAERPGAGRPQGDHDEGAGETVRRRFVRVGGASDTEVLATRLRDLVLLLRASRIPLDYVRLANQLLRWQDENQRDTVRREWGRDYHRRRWGTGSATDTNTQVDAAGDAPRVEDRDADT